jgi:signal transduction histidine kinase
MKYFITLSYLTIWALFFTTPVIAQNTITDSLEHLITQSNVHDTIKLKALTDLSWEYQKSDFNESLKWSRQLLAFSKKTKNKKFEAEAFNLLGICYDYLDYSLDTIIISYRKAIILSEKTNSLNLKANILNNMGLMYKKVGQADKALSLHQEGLKIAEKIGKKSTAIRCLNNMAVLLKDEGSLDNAKTLYKKGLKYAKEIDNQRYVSYLTNNLAYIYYAQHKIDSALNFYNMSLEIKQKMNDSTGMVTTLSNIGEMYSDLKKYNKSNKYLQEAYQIAKSIDFPYGLGLVLSRLSSDALAQKKYTAAIEYAKEGLEALGNNGDILLKSDCYHSLGESYAATGKHQFAFDNLKLFHQLKDSIYNIDKNEQLKTLEIQFEVTQKETENKLLKTEAELAKKQTRNRTFMAIGLVIILLLVIGWSIFIYKANQEKKKINEILETKVQERTKELEQVNYELRTFNYIASHDIKEPIRVIGGYVGLLFRKLPPNLKEELGEYFDTIKRSTTQLYTLIEDFANYTTMSKSETIEKQNVDLNLLTANIIDNLGETINKYKGMVEFSDLPNIQSSNSLLFTTLKNLIENGLKYNKSEKPRVNIDYQKTATTDFSGQAHHQIIISDNGIGIKPEYREKIFEMFKRLHHRGEYEGSGIGLAIVKLSVKKLGGKVRLESEEGKGSRFIIELPM